MTAGAAIKIDSLKRNFLEGGRSLEILKGINLNLSAGEIVAIVGQSGSGKSTLLSLLALLDNPDSGSIEIMGTNPQKLDISKRSQFRAENIGIIFQQFHLLPHLTALENTELPLEILGRPLEPAKKLLVELGLGERLHHFPRMLSGGECQRVAIARALATSPPILLADEPSGNLDSETGEKFMDVFFSAIEKRQGTVILVTHNPELAKRCRRRFELKAGCLSELR